MKRLRDRMTMWSRACYLLWRAGLLGESVTVNLWSGEVLILRASPLFELNAAYEIFVMDVYRCPKSLSPASVRHIVDVGSNVGYSLLYWKARYPAAVIDAFEPHPDHIEVLRRTIKLNGFDDRVTIHPVAAGTSNGISLLLSAGVASALVTRHGQHNKGCHLDCISVDVVDFFETVGGSQVDLLKLDCEGAEYPLLMDPRFEKLNVRNLVMEWHAGKDHPEAEYELIDRLRKLDWEVQSGTTVVPDSATGLSPTGIVWAFNHE